MSAQHEGKGHGEVTLSLTEHTAAGVVFQSWVVCECSAVRLRAQLGRPQHESMSTPEQFLAVGQAVAALPGGVHLGEGL